MTNRLPQFTAIPAIPQVGMSDWQFNTLNAMKDNIELLIGAKSGKNAALARAVTKAQITVQPINQVSFQQLPLQTSGYTIAGVSVPSVSDYNSLLSSVQQLAADVKNIRETLNTLIKQLKG